MAENVKNRKYDQKYLPEYSKIPGIAPSRIDIYHAYCQYCRKDFSIRRSGRYDINRHCRSTSHDDYVKLSRENRVMTNFISSGNNISEQNKAVIRAEVMFTDMITELNLPIAAADTINKVVKKAFTDSQIAKSYECGRSKTTALINSISTITETDIVEIMKNGAFSLCTDGSSDQAGKLYPLVVLYSDKTGVHQGLLCVMELEGAGTGENIYKMIKSELESHNVPVTNCIAFGSDNAPVMTGKHKGVITYMQKDFPKMQFSGCMCHLIHIAAENAAKMLLFNVDETLVDIFYYLDKSGKRIGNLGEHQTDADIRHTKILKHAPTRWLSVHKCLQRVMENWIPLKKFFKAEHEQNPTHTKADKLCTFFKSPSNKLYCLFLLNVIPLFDNLNIQLQSQEPQIHKFVSLLTRFYRELLVRFVKPATFNTGVFDCNIDFHSRVNQKLDCDLVVGQTCREFIADKANNSLRDKKITEFFSVVRKFYVTASDYVKAKFPLQDDFFSKLCVADFSKRDKVHFHQLEYFLDKFPILLPTKCSKDDIQMEFLLYQTHNFELDNTVRIDQLWCNIGKERDDCGELLFSNLSKVMLGLLCIPHSNAQCERIFSCAKKNKTPQRASLATKNLSSLLVCKSREEHCYEREYTSEQLKQLKSAYSSSLKAEPKSQ